jgi:hypothetical protein
MNGEFQAAAAVPAGQPVEALTLEDIALDTAVWTWDLGEAD